jgi:hypothetical protein
VDEVRRLLIGDFVALSQFESAVAVVGYDDRLAGEYAKLVLRIREEGLYRVVDGFPRLIPTSLSAGLPPGVNGVTYELRLEAAATWLLARTPAAAAALLCDFTR